MIRVFVADDHAVVRAGLRQLLEDNAGITVVGEAANGREVMDRLAEAECDVLVLDVSMPGRSGLDVLLDLKRDLPDLPVLIMSMHAEDQYAVRAMRTGASGYLTKDSAPDELVDAIKALAAGRRYISQQVADSLVLALNDDGDKPPHEALSDREFEVFRMLASGKTVSEIGKELALSVKTVSTYRTRILEKMSLKNNAQLTRYGFENHLID